MKNTLKKLLPFAFVGILSGATTVGALKYMDHSANNEDYSFFHQAKDVSFAGFNAATLGDDFTKASKSTVPAVVTIKNYQNRAAGRMSEQDLFEQFFGDSYGGRSQKQPQDSKDMPTGLGSGVIISPDGYIISNNHVVEGASKLEVVLSNRKTYIATLVGTDPNTDISLLKIEEKGLPYLNFANSDMLEVGQWVLAVGNPLGLNSTVTAGIISAKGRGIGILGGKGQATNPIESFIQTDAAINKGNSGGALVNINGELVGINSAIASSNGYYQGYGFAIPSNLARKIVEDIKKFGLVQRGYLGVNPLDLSNDDQLSAYNNAKKTNIKGGNGIYIVGLAEKGGAEDAGLKEGDIINNIDDMPITDFADLSLSIGSKRPGDVVIVSYTRNGKPYTAKVTLKDNNGNTASRTRADLTVSEKIGSEFVPLSKDDKINYGIDHGVYTKNVNGSGAIGKVGIVDNFIILEVNGKPVNSQKDIEKILENFKGSVQVKFADPSGRIYTRGFAMPN